MRSNHNSNSNETDPMDKMSPTNVDNPDDNSDCHCSSPTTSVCTRRSQLNDNNVENDILPMSAPVIRIPFQWTEYLQKHSVVPAQEHHFSQLHSSHELRPFEVGERLEGVDPHHESLFCVLHVIKQVGHRVRLRFDGYSPAADFWCNSNSPFLFPMGWCNRNGVQLQPPKNIHPGKFEWESYLQKHKYQAASEESFVTARQKKCEVNHEFQCGMKMEAIDRKNPAMICIATVADTLPNHILLHFDGWDDIYDQWVRPDSHLIFPSGSAKLLGQALALPQSLLRFLENDEFSWTDYLTAFNADAAPASAFRKIPYSPSTHFQVGNQVEAVDRRVPQIIRVATISNIDDKRGVLTIHYNNWLDFYNIQCEMDSPEIYPPGYCEKTGHPLEPPPDENYAPPFGDDGLCPIKGCRGLGHAKGFMYSTHQIAATCPYSELNFMKDCVQYERLEDQQHQVMPPSSCADSDSDIKQAKKRDTSNGPPTSDSQASNNKRKKFDESSSSSDLSTNKRPLRKCSTMPTLHRRPTNLSKKKSLNGINSVNGATAVPTENALTTPLNGQIKLEKQDDEIPPRSYVKMEEKEDQDYQYSLVPPLLQPSLQTCIARSVLRPFDQEMSSLLIGQRVHHKLVEELFPKEMWSHLNKTEMQSWSTHQVADFICNIVRLSPSQRDHVDVLRKRIEDAEIDGESILLLQTGDFVNYFKLPLGITVKIMTLLSYMKS